VAISFSSDEVKAYCATRLPQLNERGENGRCPCPIHEGHRDSFAINLENGLWTCHSCGLHGDLISLERALTGSDFKTAKAEIFSIVGRSDTASDTQDRKQGRIVAEYSYQDEEGCLLYQTVRLDPKDFRQRRPNPGSGWTWNLKGVRLILYRLPELLQRRSETVFVCEGEKDADALSALGFLATCNPLGAGKWRDQYAELLRGRQVVVVVDLDPATDEKGQPHFKGQKHAAAVAKSLLAHDCEVRILEPPRGKDCADWIAAGGTAEEILGVVGDLPKVTDKGLTEWTKQWSPPKPVLESAAGAWPEPLPIQHELPAVMPFSESFLPDCLGPFVRDLAERMQVPMDYPAIVLVLSLAGVVSRRAVVQPKENDTGWIVVPNLWGGIIAPPGFMKSPVIQAATRLIHGIQTKWRREYSAALTDHEIAKEESELRHSAWREIYKSNTKKGRSTPERPTDSPTAPVLRRLIINDATFEALHQMMSENPAGILVIRDELTGWWSVLDRTGREGERAFCLQAWNGDTGHTIDRIGRGTIHVDACCMSMLGGIQPARLRSYLADALFDGPSNDGLIQRFQLLVYPDTNSEWTYIDRPPDPSMEDKLSRIFHFLVELDATIPLRFRFEPRAQQLFVAWLTDLERKVRGTDLHPALISHLSKYRSLMPSLALLFELAERAEQGVAITIASDLYISLENAKRAATLCDYLESHANRIYSCVTTPQMRAAQELAEKVKTRKVGQNGSFTCRDVYIKGWSGLDSPEAVRQAAKILEDAGWIREVSGDSGPQGGRPSPRYQVNPRIWN
jgi:putative DNA primase/helicase